MRVVALLLGVATPLLLAGCQRAHDVTLELTPAVVSECDVPVQTSVRWDVSHAGPARLRLEINDLAAPRKLWTIGSESGEADAPKWAYDGYTVSLVTEHGEVLARRTLTTTPCPR